MSSTEEIIGRSDIDDLEAILSITNKDVDAVAHEVEDNAHAIFTWDYERSRPALGKLYEKAKSSQWNAQTDLPWETPVDQEAVVLANVMANGGFDGGVDVSGTPLEKWGDKEWIEFGVQSQNWTLSQFMHGEQGALLCTAKIVGSVPWVDAKYYASTQVMDEARHMEVFAKYLDEKLSGHYPINAHLRLLLDDIIKDSRWDMTYLGMQIMVEGLALAAFGFIHQMTTEPLLKQLLRYVMADEARHVAFGVLSLRDYYHDMSANELADREDFIIYASELMRDRLIGSEFARAMSWNVQEVQKAVLESEVGRMFRSMLFQRIVPNLKKLGLLTPKVRAAYTRLDLIRFEDFDSEAADRQLGFL